MIKVLSIDDEPLALQQLSAYIRRTPFLELCGECQSAQEAQAAMEREHIDAIFSDINMPDLNGLDFVRSLLAPPIVVFTTAYSEYALEGFKVNALHYLLKPFSMDEFRHAAEKVKRQYDLQAGAAATADGQITTPVLEVDDANEPRVDADAIYLKTDYKVVRVDIKNIIYVESMGSYLRFHVKGMQRPIMALLTMKKIEERLPSTRFMRTHRSYIVNLHEIVEISRNHVVLTGDLSLPIGDLYRDNFNAYLNAHFLTR